MKRITKFLAAVSIFGMAAVSTNSAAEDANEWAIQVKMYRGYPPGEFQALGQLASIMAHETAKGFLLRTQVSRDDVHLGATFCMLVDSRVFTAADERSRILETIRNLRPEGQFVEFSVSNPSSCFTQQ